MFQNLRARFSRKSAAAILVFAVALTATGLGTAATLQDQATTTISASITSIDLSVNNEKAATIDFGQVLPGTVAYAPLQFRNSGSGYLRLSLSSTSNGSPVTLDSVVQFIPGLFAANCNATDAPFNAPFAVSVAQPVIDLDDVSANTDRILGASGTTGPNGDTFSVCAIYRVGTSTGVGYGMTGFQTVLTANGTHP